LILETPLLFSKGALYGDNVRKYSESIDLIAYCCDIPGFEDLTKEKAGFVSAIFHPENKISSIDDFYRIGSELLEKRIDPSEARILFRFHADSGSLGKIIQSSGYRSTLEILGHDDYMPLLKESHNINTQAKYYDGFWEYAEHGTWCQFRRKEKNFRTAATAAINDVEFLRSLINFRLNLGKGHVDLKHVPLSDLPPSRWYFEIYKGSIYHWRYSFGDWEYKDYVISEDVIAPVIDFIEKVEALRESELKKSIVSSISLYNEAIDSNKYQYVFLILWSIIDILVPRIEKNERLLSNIYLKDREQQAALISLLHEKRNRFVHAGKYEIFSIDDVNYLKKVIEDLVLFAFGASGIAQNAYDIAYLLEKMENPKRAIRELELLEYVRKELSMS
jgi:hypothetical protein